MGKKINDNDIPLLHIYSQRYPHDEAVIIASSSGLVRLKESIEKALEIGEDDCVVTTPDMESYEIKVILSEENWRTEFWQRIQYPYSEDDENEETLTVDDIIGYGIRKSEDIGKAQEIIKADRRYSQELTYKLRSLAERNAQE